jgi:hypothetical protein
MTRKVPDLSLKDWVWVGLWLAVIAVAVLLRTWQLGHQILIDDEWHAIHRLMQASYRDIFLSFGHADYTIPLTLFFKLLADTIGLGEWRMRALPLLSGLATVVLLPWVLRPWLARQERWLLAGLIAISPLLIHFTRYVRPYALTVPLMVVAMVALWRWWHERRAVWAWVFVPCATLAAWLHPLTLLFTASGLVWFALAAGGRWWRGDGAEGFRRIVPLGALTTVLCSALVLPPLLADPAAMSSKSGIHQLQWATFPWSWQLMVGTAAWLPALALFALAVLGAVVLARRDTGFAGYWLFAFCVALAVISQLDAAWIHHALVLVRYTAVVQPMVLMLVALGLAGIARRLASGARQAWLTVGLSLALLAGLYAVGPLPETYRGLNQFTSHMRYHFDYDFEDSVYTQVMGRAELPDFYDRLADEPGDWVLIEAPWHFESHMSPLSEYQREHQMKLRIGMISGLCADWTYGELEYASDQHIVFRHFVFLADILKRPSPENRFVILHRESLLGQGRELADIEPCIDAFREAYGPAWYEDDEAVVFRVPAGE